MPSPHPALTTQDVQDLVCPDDDPATHAQKLTAFQTWLSSLDNTPKPGLGAGEVTSAQYVRGFEPHLPPCDECDCACHDEPSPHPGTYVTIRLDNEDAPIGKERVTISTATHTHP